MGAENRPRGGFWPALCAGAGDATSLAAAAPAVASFAGDAIDPSAPWTRRAAGLRVVKSLSTRCGQLNVAGIEAWLDQALALSGCEAAERRQPSGSAAETWTWTS